MGVLTIAKVDDKKRVRIPDAKPGQLVSVQSQADGVWKLSLVTENAEEPPANIRLVKEDGYTVALSDRPIDMAALNKALQEFP